MSRFIRALPFALAALLLLLAIGCNTSGGKTTAEQAGTDQTSGDTAADESPDGDRGPEDVVSSEPLEVLSASAERFQDEAQSFQADLDFTMTAGSFSVDASAMMAFQAPDQMHMTMDISGLGSYEMLLLGTEIYMNIPPQGWVVFSLDDAGLDELGVDPNMFQELVGDHSFLDYDSIIESLGGEVEDMGEETVDGVTVRHLRATLDFADLEAAFSDAFGATDGLGLDSVAGPMTFDVWVDPETFLPHRMIAVGEFGFGTESMVFEAAMSFSNFNEPVEIPEAPADAVPFAAIFEGLQ